MKRFLNADSYASTGQGFLGYNMFAYCNNCPVIGADPAGHEMYFFNYLDIGGEDSYTDGISKALVYSADCTGGGGICGGYGSNIIEFPTTSIIGRTLVSVAAITGAGAMVGNCLAPAAYPNEDDDDDSNNTIYIFRRNGTNPGNLVPRDKEAALSFQLTPVRNSWVTTIDILNSSEMFRAEIDGPDHVSVYPIGIDTHTWHSQGVLSPWTQELIKLCTKLK